MSIQIDGLFIGIDVGTQGTKSVLIDGKNGKVLSESREPYPLYEKPDGTREQDPQDWINAVVKTVKKITGNLNAKDRAKIIGIGVSGQQHGLVPLDKNGEVIRRAKLWNDTSTIRQCETIIERLGGVERAIEYTGNNILPGYTAPKVLWLKENEPENYSKLSKILLPHDYINYFLTGEIKAEPGDASGTAYFDVKNRKWSYEVLNAIDDSGKLLNCLPDLIDSVEPVGYVKHDVAELLGFSAEQKIIVSSGGGDNMMGAIGTGNTKDGIVTVSLGTSGTVYAYSSRPVIDRKGEFAAFCDSTGGWLPLACTMNVTVATEMIKRLFNLNNDGLEEKVTGAEAGSKGLILLPYFNGERTPNVPFGTGVFFGVNEFTLTAENLARSAMEGVTMGLMYGLDCMKREGIKPEEIRLTGGGSKSEVWRQVVADVFNSPAVNMEVEEGASLGAAVQSMWCYLNSKGEKVDISSITDRLIEIKEQTRCIPNKGRSELYKELFNLQTDLSRSLIDVFKKHRDILIRRFQQND